MHNPYTNNLGHWVKRFHQMAAGQVNEVLKPYGLARSQWNVLFYIHQSGDLAQKDLQSLLQVESATLTGILDSLIRKQWIERTPSPTDRRAKILKFTISGVEHWKTVPDPITVVSKKALAGIPQKDILLARQVLEQAVHNLEA